MVCGGTDITPYDLEASKSKELANFFHAELKKICDQYKKGSYKKFKNGVMNIFFFLIEMNLED